MSKFPAVEANRSTVRFNAIRVAILGAIEVETDLGVHPSGLVHLPGFDRRFPPIVLPVVLFG